MTLLSDTSGNLGDIVFQGANSGGYLDLADGRRVLLSEIDTAASKVAARAAQAGWRRGDRVVLLANNGTDFTAAYLGLMRAGMVAVPVSYRLPADTVAYIMSDCAAVGVLTSPEHARLAPAKIARFDITDFGRHAGLPTNASIRPGPGEIAEILYTSGSTGRPKGVPLSHDGQLWALKRFLAVSAPAPQSTIIAAPAYHMNGLFFTTVALALGYFAISMPRFDARQYLQLAAEHRCTLISGIPTMFALMARQVDLLHELDLSSVTDVIIGSAPLTQALVDRVHAIFPNATVRNSYGTTETGPAMFGPHPAGLARPQLAIGYPYPDVEWRLVGGATPDEGELHTRTPATLAGYLNLPEVTRQRLQDGWYATGDVLRRDAQGFFHFVGRADDMFVCGGENVYPGEVEKLLERHPAVLEAAVVSVSDEIKGAIPIAFIVKSAEVEVSADEIKAFALEHGPAFSHPRAVVFLDHMPLGGTHKIDKALLSARAADLAKTMDR